MAKSTSQRRFTKVVDELTGLRLNHPKRFQIMSRTYFRGWVQEVQRRAAAQTQYPVGEPTPATYGLMKSSRDQVR